MLAREVAEAARYVASLLPEPLPKGPIQVEWRFIPSTQLGGDSFGYHRLDDDHFAFYLLDVSGHGVGASLLSVSAMNVLACADAARRRFPRPRPGVVRPQQRLSDGPAQRQIFHHLVWCLSAERPAADVGGRRPPGGCCCSLGRTPPGQG